MPKLRFAVPLGWQYEGHALRLTMRYIGSYNDDSETTIEKYGLAQRLAAPRTPGRSRSRRAKRSRTGPSSTSATAFTFGDEEQELGVAVGVINLLDQAPPEAEGPLGYDMLRPRPQGPDDLRSRQRQDSETVRLSTPNDPSMACPRTRGAVHGGEDAVVGWVSRYPQSGVGRCQT